MVDIAVIDNGVSQDLILNKTVTKSVSFCDKKEDKNGLFLHGTIVSLIIVKYLKECNIISIRILDNNGTGSIGYLEDAFKWCVSNGVYIVNLSFGTTCFQDKKKIQRCINYYANKGLCIIAAAANNGFVTYPASFSNVIGVVNYESANDALFNWRHLGIDVWSKSNHSILIQNKRIETPAGNSYAAPYITALIGSIISGQEKYNVCEVKKMAKKENAQNEWFELVCPLPDREAKLRVCTV